MKIALFGYGKMGKLIELAALERGDEIVGVFTSQQHPLDTLAQADVALDFSTKEAVINNVLCCAKTHTNLVIGTTGWVEQLPQVKTAIEQAQIGALFSPNFSLGVLLFLELLKTSASLFSSFGDYGVTGHEVHHAQKQDAPSGTALAIKALLETKLKQVEFSSLRQGSTLGEHTVLFDSIFDTISLQHTAKTRQGYAKGALTAANWLRGKQGFYTIDDFIRGVLYAS